MAAIASLPADVVRLIGLWLDVRSWAWLSGTCRSFRAALLHRATEEPGRSARWLSKYWADCFDTYYALIAAEGVTPGRPPRADRWGFGGVWRVGVAMRTGPIDTLSMCLPLGYRSSLMQSIVQHRALAALQHLARWRTLVYPDIEVLWGAAKKGWVDAVRWMLAHEAPIPIEGTRMMVFAVPLNGLARECELNCRLPHGLPGLWLQGHFGEWARRVVMIALGCACVGGHFDCIDAILEWIARHKGFSTDDEPCTECAGPTLIVPGSGRCCAMHEFVYFGLVKALEAGAVLAARRCLASSQEHGVFLGRLLTHDWTHLFLAAERGDVLEHMWWIVGRTAALAADPDRWAVPVLRQRFDRWCMRGRKLADYDWAPVDRVMDLVHRCGVQPTPLLSWWGQLFLRSDVAFDPMLHAIGIERAIARRETLDWMLPLRAVRGWKLVSSVDAAEGFKFVVGELRDRGLLNQNLATSALQVCGVIANASLMDWFVRTSPADLIERVRWREVFASATTGEGNVHKRALAIVQVAHLALEYGGVAIAPYPVRRSCLRIDL